IVADDFAQLPRLPLFLHGQLHVFLRLQDIQPFRGQRIRNEDVEHVSLQILHQSAGTPPLGSLSPEYRGKANWSKAVGSRTMPLCRLAPLGLRISQFSLSI